MERITRDVPIWQCEEGRDGDRAWVHPDRDVDPAGRTLHGTAAGQSAGERGAS